MRTTTMMPRMHTWTRILAIVLLVLAVLSAMAPGAGAADNQLVRECTGVIEGGAVDGDLVVPAGASCELRGASVRGDVRLAGGGDDFANLRAVGARIVGDLWIGQQAIASLDDTRVGGSVEARGTWAVLDASGGAIGGQVWVEDAERLNLIGTVVGGDVRFGQSRLIVARGAQVRGHVRVADVEFAAVVESRVSGDLAVGRASREARLCNSRVGGDAAFDANGGQLAIGGGAYRCTGNRIDGHLLVHQNTGGATIADNLVRSDLICRDNDPAPVGGNNWVGGEKQGQCGGL